MSTQQEGPVGDANYIVPWVPRISSRLTHISYLEDLQVIYVRFPDGTEWEYARCSLEEWEAFCSADSLGRHINTNLNAPPNRRRSVEERARVAGFVPEGDPGAS